MKLRSIVILAMVLCVLCVPMTSEALSMAKYEPGFSVAQVVDASVVVVVGRVVETDFVYRANVSPTYTTDITIEVEDFIKGEANAGENRVKFMTLGGADDRPETPESERRVAIVSGEPKFEVNEQVLMFFSKSTRPGLNYAYGGLRPFYIVYGKRKVVDNKVELLYTLGDGSTKKVKVPLDFAKTLGKAAIADKDALARLENRIRAEIVKCQR